MTREPPDVALGTPLANGYSVVADASAAELRVVAPDQRVCLTITLLPEGPRVELRAGSLRIAAEREVNLACDALTIEARGDIALRAGGAITTEAAEQTHRSTRGDVTVSASDDLYLDGETVNLDVPHENRPPAAPPALRTPAPGAGGP